MQKLITCFFIICAFFMSAQENFNYKRDFKTILAKTANPSDKLFYDKLLPRYQKNDTTLTDAEVLALMIGFTNKKEYQPYSDAIEEKAIYDLNAEGKYYLALEKARDYIKTHPFSLKTLFEISFSYYKANHIDSAKLYVAQGKRIFKAMEYSGNGRKKDTPMFALNPTDGQEYIYKHLGGGIGLVGQDKDPDGNSLDILEVDFKVGTSYTLYFIIQHATSRLPIEDPVKKEKKEKAKSNK